MAAIITNKLRIFNAQEFLQSINRAADAWVANTAYFLGEEVVKDGNLFICKVAGTSSATGPNSVGADITDGGVTWKHIGQSVYNRLYMSIGKPTAWLNDANPPTPEDSIGYGYTVKNAATAMKKVGIVDMTLAIPRINWTANTVYTMYEHDLAEEIIPNSYVITEGNNQYNVYKCLNNQSFVDDSTTSIAVASTVKPTATSANIETTSDGYKWKYMYSIALTKSLKFLTKDYVPVESIQFVPADTTSAEHSQWQVQQAAISTPGSVDQVKIMPNEVNGAVTGGIGYQPNITRTMDLPTSTTTFTLTGVETSIASYVGYHVIDITGAPTEQFKITGWVVTGTTVAVTVDGTLTGGTSRSIIIAPGITTLGNGTGFKAYGLVTGGKVSNIVISNSGTNYTNVTSATIDTALIPAAISGANNVDACKVKVIVGPTNGHGFDAIEELAGYYIMIAMRLEYDEISTRVNDLSASTTRVMFPVSGTPSVFRQLAIIADPVEKTSLIPATADSYRGPAYTGAWGTANETTFDVESGSGKVLYIENRQPVSRAIDQIEDVKVVFEF